MEKLFKRETSKKLRYALCIAIIPLSSPLAVQGVLSLMPISSAAIVPLVVTFMTLAYAWCIWEIWNFPNSATPDEEKPHENEIDWQPSEAS